MGATLLLRALYPSDAGPLHAVLNDPAVCRFLPALPSPNLAATRHYLGLCGLLAECDGIATMVLADAAAPETSFGLVQTGWRDGAVEVGMLLGRAWWGRGLMACALDQVLASPVAAWRGATHATAACDAANEAARRMLVRAGFTQAGTLPSFRVHPALGPAPRDCVLFRRALGPMPELRCQSCADGAALTDGPALRPAPPTSAEPYRSRAAPASGSRTRHARHG